MNKNTTVESDKFAPDLSHMTDSDWKKLFAANDQAAKERQARDIANIKKLREQDQHRRVR